MKSYFVQHNSQRKFVMVLLLLLLSGCQIVEELSSASDRPTIDTPTDSPQTLQDSSLQPTQTIAASPYSRRSIPPFLDQVQQGSSFYQFRQRLQQAIKQRDAKFIAAIADPYIKLTFGRDLKLSALGFDDPNSLSWRRLERIVTIGCAPYEAPTGVDMEAYQCPHISQAAIGDPFTDIYILGEGINVRERPQANSAIVGVLTYELVKFDPAGFDRLTDQQREQMQTLDGWMPVITPQGRRGYVSSRYGYFAAGYRARFEQNQGQWKMTIFISGD